MNCVDDASSGGVLTMLAMLCQYLVGGYGLVFDDLEKSRREIAAYPAPRPVIRVLCIWSLTHSPPSPLHHPSLARPSSVFSFPRIPNNTGHTTLILHMRMSIREAPRQHNSACAKIETAMTPIGSAVLGDAPASSINCEITA